MTTSQFLHKDTRHQNKIPPQGAFTNKSLKKLKTILAI